MGEVFLGDLQETMTTAKKDNAGGTKYKRLKFGVLNTIADSNKIMRSSVFEKEGSSYITRVPLSGAERGGRGISHIMIDSRMEERYIGGCIDPLLSKATCGTADHFIVAAEFNLDISNFYLLNRTPVTRYKWGLISNILMDDSEIEEGEGEVLRQPEYDTPHTEGKY